MASFVKKDMIMKIRITENKITNKTKAMKNVNAALLALAFQSGFPSCLYFLACFDSVTPYDMVEINPITSPPIEIAAYIPTHFDEDCISFMYVLFSFDKKRK